MIKIYTKKDAYALEIIEDKITVKPDNELNYILSSVIMMNNPNDRLQYKLGWEIVKELENDLILTEVIENEFHFTLWELIN